MTRHRWLLLIALALALAFSCAMSVSVWRECRAFGHSRLYCIGQVMR